MLSVGDTLPCKTKLTLTNCSRGYTLGGSRGYTGSTHSHYVEVYVGNVLYTSTI